MRGIPASVKSAVPLCIREAIRLEPGPGRWLTGCLRMTPEFVIIGGLKCGTTSLYRYLIQHPSIAPAVRKEIQFFSCSYHRGTAWYRGFFPTRIYQQYMRCACRRDVITGEASPQYVWYPQVARRMRATLPGVKLIALVRDPVDRAISNYHHWTRVGYEPHSLEEAIRREMEYLAVRQTASEEERRERSRGSKIWPYLEWGIYVDQLEIWRRLFPEEQLMILQSEEFFADPAATVRRVLAFLHLSEWDLQDTRRHNDGQYPPTDPGTRERLIEFFRPHNRRLYEALGQEFGWAS